jgi:hypothetical protein
MFQFVRIPDIIGFGNQAITKIKNQAIDHLIALEPADRRLSVDGSNPKAH